MRKKLLLLVGAALLLSGCSLPSFLQKKAGLSVTIANGVPTTVSLNGGDVGQAPYSSNNLKAGSYTIKLTPQDATKPAYETTISLNPGLMTVMNWTFGTTPDESGGEIFEMAPSSGGKTELSIVTDPDNIIVKIDGQSKGFSPLILSDLSAGTHTLTLSAPGYVERSSTPSLITGYRVTVTSKLGREPESAAVTNTASSSAQLAPMPSPTATPKTSPKPSPKASPKASPLSQATSTTTSTASSSGVITTSGTPALPYVEISQTSTGWLRVRATADSNGTEVAKLASGDKVPYVASSNGWLEVTYQSGSQGWVSGQYAVLHNQ
jgi:hypothetical protein